MSARYEITKVFEGGYYFELHSGSSLPLLRSGEKTTLTLCRNTIASVRMICDSPLEDTEGITGDKTPVLNNPKYVIEKNKERRYVLRLIAKNGKTVAQSSGYVNVGAVLSTLGVIKRVAAFAPVSEKILNSFT